MANNQKSKLPIGPEEYIITEQKPPETRANTCLGGGDQRAAFEAWISSPPRNHKISRSGERAMYPGRYEYYEAQIAWEAWQAGRAAHQSQDREDAERLKYLLGKVCMYQAADYGCKFEILNLPPHFGDCEPDPIQPFLAAIDHARRVEGKS